MSLTFIKQFFLYSLTTPCANLAKQKQGRIYNLYMSLAKGNPINKGYLFSAPVNVYAPVPIGSWF